MPVGARRRLGWRAPFKSGRRWAVNSDMTVRYRWFNVMIPCRPLVGLLGLLLAVAAHAQTPGAPAAAGDGLGADAAGQAATADDRAWRDTAAYPFGAWADTTLRLELVAKAMQLRDYCANRRVPDDFVRERLRRFSALSGRQEDCRSLLDY